MPGEARLEQTERGVVPSGDGWFVLNARDARWFDRGPRGVVGVFEGEPEFDQLGINLFVLGPGEPMSMYHWEADQEDFLVVSGEALLIIEGEERPLRQWDCASCACTGCDHSPTPSSAGNGSKSSSNTSAKASRANDRTSSTLTGRPSSLAIVVNDASASPHAVIQAVNGARSRSTLSAYPCVVIHLLMWIPIEAIFRGGR